MVMDSATELAGLGFKVIQIHGLIQRRDGSKLCTCRGRQCSSPAKHPVYSNWPQAATSDTEEIKRRWSKTPWANVGIVTGAVSGVVVVDIDPIKGGEDTWSALVKKRGGVPDTAEVLTGGGGRHIYFRHPGFFVRNSVQRLGPGVDIRGDGGYVVAPGSIHVSGRRYEWEASSEPSNIAEMPAWLKREITISHKACPIERGLPVPEGGRNNFLASLGGLMRRYGLSRAALEEALLIANRDRCHPPLDDEEVRAIAKSIARYSPEV